MDGFSVPAKKKYGESSGASLAAAGLFAGLWMRMDVANEPKLSGNEFLSC